MNIKETQQNEHSIAAMQPRVVLSPMDLPLVEYSNVFAGSVGALPARKKDVWLPCHRTCG